MPNDAALAAIDERGVATVTLDRPEVHNACDEPVIEALCALAARRRLALPQRRGRDDRRRPGSQGAGAFGFLKDMLSEEDWQALEPKKAR
jgi:hypothetical protein